jgi:hypothetical protein
LLRHRAVIALATLTISAPAGAQSTAEPRAEAKVHAGPLHFTPSFAIKDFGVDTNVFNNTEQKHDFTVTLSPHVDLWVPFARRALLTVSTTSDLVYYQTYSSERSVDPEVKVRGEIFVNRLTLFAQPTYRRTRQQMNFELDARAQRQERTAEAGVTLRASHKLVVEFTASLNALDFDADAIFDGTSLQQTLNHDSRTASVTLRQDLTHLTAVVFRAENGTDRFPLSPERDAESLRVTPGIELRSRALVTGTAYVGVRSFKPYSPLLTPFRGAVARASLAYPLADATRFAFTADRDLSYSYESVQPYFVIQGYGVAVERRLTSRTDTTFGLQRYRYSYRDLAAPGASAVDVGRVDAIRTLSASFGYRFARTTRTGLGISYRSRESSSAERRNYHGLRVTAIADYGF